MKKALGIAVTIFALFSLIACGTEEQVSSSVSSETTLSTNTSEQSSLETISSSEGEDGEDFLDSSSNIESSSSSSEEQTSSSEVQSSDPEATSSDSERINSSHTDDSVQKYHVTFLNYDDSILYECDVEEGQAATYGGKTPTRDTDDEFAYTFNGWDKELINITSDLIVVAVYTKTKIEWTTIVWL